jgi:hypothetical protein
VFHFQKRSAEKCAVTDLTDSDDPTEQSDSMTEPLLKREKLTEQDLQSCQTRMTPSPISPASTLESESVNFPVILPSVSSGINKKFASKTWGPATATTKDLEQDEHNALMNRNSDVYFPLSVEEDSKNSLILTVSSSVGAAMNDQEMLGNNQDQGAPVPISEPIPSAEIMRAGKVGSNWSNFFIKVWAPARISHGQS